MSQKRIPGVNVNKLGLKITGRGGAKSRAGGPPSKSRGAAVPAKDLAEAAAKIRGEKPARTKTTSAASKRVRPVPVKPEKPKFVSRPLTAAEKAAKLAQKKLIRKVAREKPAKKDRKPRAVFAGPAAPIDHAAAMKKKAASGLDTYQRAAMAARFADDRKAQSILVLDVSGLCNFADVFVICTATNRVQLNAIAENVSMGLKKAGEKTPLQDGHRNANWSVLDFGDVVVHVMSEDARAFYRLEKLWGDAKELNWNDVLATMPLAAGAEK